MRLMLSRMRIAALLTVLMACTDAGRTDEIGKVVVEDCGEAPLYPGTVVAFDNGLATMSIDAYRALNAWMESSAQWRDCVVQHP